jgi:hypothetical protein
MNVRAHAGVSVDRNLLGFGALTVLLASAQLWEPCE